MTIYILFAVSIIINILLIYGIINLYKKLNNCEELVDYNEKWSQYFILEIEKLYNSLKLIDDKNLFEKDDEVGFIFSEILKITEEFKEKIK